VLYVLALNALAAAANVRDLSPSRLEATMRSGSATLRELIDCPGLIVVPECYSVLTARIVEARGFPAVCFGGSGANAMHFGLPDYGLVALEQIADFARRITTSVGIPLIVDAGCAGETFLDVRRAVQSLEGAGAAGIHIGDSTNPRHPNSRSHLQSTAEMCGRIHAAVDARSDSSLVLIARADKLACGGQVDEAVRRGIAYANAGADVFMCFSIPFGAIDHVAAEIPIPLMTANVRTDRAATTNLKLNAFLGAAYLAAAAYEETIDNISVIGEPAEPFVSRAVQSRVCERYLQGGKYIRLTEEWIDRFAEEAGARSARNN
jgi:2-methylisocitrate lyase-like PEP mutase family enzyme